MRTVKVADLVGTNIAGIRANVTRPIHREMLSGGRIVTLQKAEWKRKEGFRWLFLYWDKTTGNMPTCGYSGWREDVGFTPTIELLGGLV